MKKLIAFTLVLCMMLAAFPACGETAGSRLGVLLNGLLSGREGAEGEDGSLNSLLSGLADKLKKEGKEGASALSAKVKEELTKALKDPDGKLKSLLSGLVKGLDTGDSADLKALLAVLLGGGESAEGTAEDGETIEETLERLNKEAEAETGENVANRKDAESVEEFYGQWRESRFTLYGEDYDMGEYNEGVFIGENTYYVTIDGEKSEDYRYPETAELTIRDGILKINSDGHWSSFVLTQDGEMVEPTSSMVIYFVRVQ